MIPTLLPPRARPTPARTAALMLFAAALTSLSRPAVAHPMDELNTYSISIDIKGEGRIEETLYLPSHYFLPGAFGSLGLAPLAEEGDRACRDRVSAWLRDLHPVEADGQMLLPEVMSVRMVGIGYEEVDFPVQAAKVAGQKPDVDALLRAQTRVVVKVVYQATKTPRTLRINWLRFPHYLQPPPDPVPISLFIQGDRVCLSELSAKEPEYVWTSEAPPAMETRVSGQMLPRSFGVPVASVALLAGCIVLAAWGRRRRRWLGLAAIGCLGAGTLAFLHVGEWRWALKPRYPAPPADPTPELQLLVQGIYNALALRSDADVYQALSTCADGPVLPVLYTEAHKAMALSDREGGGLCLADRVALREVRRVAVPPGNEPGAFAAHVDWTVYGRLAHFGHAHEISPAFGATFIIAPRQAQSDQVGWVWKIVDWSLDATQPETPAKPASN